MSVISVFVCDVCGKRDDGVDDPGYARKRRPVGWFYLDGADCCCRECVLMRLEAKP